MINTILAIKKDQTQKFLEDGSRIPVTEVEVMPNMVTFIKTLDKDGYVAVQLGINKQKHPTKAELGHVKKAAKLEFAPKFLKEVRLFDNEKMDELPKLGEALDLLSIFEAGDIINVTGISKGKGFAGVVKRHHFKGGPRTHGQSDRERAPGSIGQTTTPGRVYKNKRMAGKMGFENVTITNLQIMEVLPGSLLIKGLVPGVKGANLVISKKGKSKKFIPLLKHDTEEKVKESVEITEKKEEVK